MQHVCLPFRPHLLAMVFLIALPTAAFTQSTFVPEIQPNPEYMPDEVVGIQMRALGNNDQPFDDAGIELTFRFASPGNKINTGPIEKFTSLFSNPAYQPMINHQTLKIGDAEIRDDQARVPVMIESSEGRQMVYLFALSKQSESPYIDCWMTDSVTPVRMTDSDSPSIM